MASKKISELDAISSVAATDLFAVSSSGTDKKATALQIKTYALTADYSLSEQVWPYATWLGDTIYWRTWHLTDATMGYQYLTGLTIGDVFIIDWHTRTRSTLGGFQVQRMTEQFIDVLTGDYQLYVSDREYDCYVTVWYTKI